MPLTPGGADPSVLEAVSASTSIPRRNKARTRVYTSLKLETILDEREVGVVEVLNTITVHCHVCLSDREHDVIAWDPAGAGENMFIRLVRYHNGEITSVFAKSGA